MAIQWYCRIDDVPYGPLSQSDVLTMAKNGNLSTQDFLRVGKTGQWHQAGHISWVVFPQHSALQNYGETALATKHTSVVATKTTKQRTQEIPRHSQNRTVRSKPETPMWLVVPASIVLFLAALLALGVMFLFDDRSPNSHTERNNSDSEKELVVAPRFQFRSQKNTGQKSILPPRADDFMPSPLNSIPPLSNAKVKNDSLDTKGKKQHREKRPKKISPDGLNRKDKYESNGKKQFQRQRRFAVVRQNGRKVYDSIEKVLRGMGEGYRYEIIDEMALWNSQLLSKYDVIFLPCGTYQTNFRTENNLRDYVKQGGTIYASDLRFVQISRAFRDYVKTSSIRRGRRLRKAVANINDPNLRELFNSNKIGIRFDMNGWYPAAFHRDKVNVLLEGNYHDMKFRKHFGYFLVTFNYGKGSVVFTSFHNGAQRNDTEQKLLRYLVVTTVTATIETYVRRTIFSGGFSPQSFLRLGMRMNDQQVTSTYDNKKTCRLRFALGIINKKANFQLTLISPNGKKYSRSGNRTFYITIDDAPVGQWDFTVTAKSIPYDNFPFTLTVGEATK